MKNFSSDTSAPRQKVASSNTVRWWLSVAIGVLVGNLIFLGIVALIIRNTNFEEKIFKPIGKAIGEGMEPGMIRASKIAATSAQKTVYETVDGVQDQAIEGMSRRVVEAVSNTRDDIINDAREVASSYLDQYQ